MKPFTKNDFGWVAVMTKARCEVAAAVEAKRELALWTFYPSQRYRRRRRVPGTHITRVFQDDIPIISRYIFVRLIDDGDIMAVNELRNVACIVKQPGTDRPLAIPAHIMDRMMAEDDRRPLIDEVKEKKYAPGQKIVFNERHPMAGLLGQVSRHMGKDIWAWFNVFGSKREIRVDPAHVAAA